MISFVEVFANQLAICILSLQSFFIFAAE